MSKLVKTPPCGKLKIRLPRSETKFLLSGPKSKNLVFGSKMRRAKILLDEAKKKVEDLIEAKKFIL